MNAPADSDPLIGQVIAGRYKILRRIGKGGMGAIYEVEHQKVRRHFAMKVLAASLAENPEALARFHREADVIGQLHHPNIVEIVDWESVPSGAPCLIMELLRGHDLAHRLKQSGPLPWKQIAQIADPVLSALMVAHRAGVVHRDLKPENIFIARDDNGEEHPKLLDFGVSKIRGSESIVTADTNVIGTPAYMSPEQAKGEVAEVGPATDVWAMGAILFEMATAKQAFTATSTPAVLYRICYEEPEPVAPLRPDAPPGFVDLVGRVLSKNPLQRVVAIEPLRARLRLALTDVAQGAFADPITGQVNLYGELDPAKTELYVGASAQPASAAVESPEASPAAPRVTTFSRATGEMAIIEAAASRTSRAGLVGMALGGLAIVALGAGITSTLLRRKTPAPVATLIAQPPAPPAPPAPVDRIAIVPPRQVTVKRLPANAAMTLDGTPVAGSVLALPADGKPHTLHVSAPGYLDEERTLDAQTVSPLLVKLRKPSAKPAAAKKSGKKSFILEP